MAISKNQPMRSAELDLIDVVNDAELENLPQLIEEVSTLEETVGNNDSGLVKNVSDLLTTVGNNNYGLVKDVSDLKTTVGDDDSGMAKDVVDLQTDVSILETTVGDENSGLVKSVTNLSNIISYIECGETQFSNIQDGSYQDIEITLANEYDENPVITATRHAAGSASANLEIAIAGRSTTAFTIRVYNKDSITVNPKIGWIATSINKHSV